MISIEKGAELLLLLLKLLLLKMVVVLFLILLRVQRMLLLFSKIKIQQGGRLAYLFPVWFAIRVPVVHVLAIRTGM